MYYYMYVCEYEKTHSTASIVLTIMFFMQTFVKFFTTPKCFHAYQHIVYMNVFEYDSKTLSFNNNAKKKGQQ